MVDVRGLSWYERMLCGMSVNSCVLFSVPDGVSVSKEQVENAFVASSKEYPSLRVVVKRDGKIPSRFVRPDRCPRQVEEIQSKDVVSDWERLFIQFINNPHPVDSLWSALLIRDEADCHRFGLVLSMCHSLCDGPSFFYLVKALLSNLNTLIEGKVVVETPERDLCDLWARVPSVGELPPARHNPENTVTNPNAVLTLPDDMPPVVDSEIAQGQAGVWVELDNTIASDLFRQCHEHGVTVQGVVSAASVVAWAWNEKLVDDFSVTVMSPASQRENLKPLVEADEAVCAAAGLWWHQKIVQNASLWDLAKTATVEVKASIAEKQGVRWWHSMATMMTGKPAGWVPKAPIMSSNVGRNVMDASLSSLSVDRVSLLGGAYGIPPPAPAAMLHAHTFDGKLCLSIAYTRPQFTRAWAVKFADVHFKFFCALASGAGGETSFSEFVRVLGRF